MDVNLIFGMFIGVLFYLALGDFMRPGGLWFKRSRVLALIRVRTNRLRRRMRLLLENPVEAEVPERLFWALVGASVLALMVLVLGFS
jgi:hypothetical protein